MIAIWIRFRSQGMQWPLRAGDTLEVRNEQHEAVMEFPGELILEMIQHYIRAIEIQRHMVNGTSPTRKPLAPASTPDLIERRRQARRSRRKLA